MKSLFNSAVVPKVCCICTKRNEHVCMYMYMYHKTSVVGFWSSLPDHTLFTSPESRMTDLRTMKTERKKKRVSINLNFLKGKI